MSSKQLPNYLLANRKRLSLSQAEVAFLLGVNDGTNACRYERFQRLPNLETALAFEVIFGQPLCELFGGIYRKAEARVAERAKSLAAKVGKANPRKQALLLKLANATT